MLMAENPRPGPHAAGGWHGPASRAPPRLRGSGHARDRADAAEASAPHGGQLLWPTEHRSRSSPSSRLGWTLPRALDFRRCGRGSSCSSWSPLPKNCSSCSAAAVIHTSRHTGTGAPTLSPEQRRRGGPDGVKPRPRDRACLPAGAWKTRPGRAPVPGGRADQAAARRSPQRIQEACPFPTSIDLSHFGYTDQATTAVSWRGGSLGALQQQGQVSRRIGLTVTCPEIRWPPALVRPAPAPSRYSQPRAGRSATECERSR